MDYKTQRHSVEESLLLQELAGKITKEWLDIGRFLAIPEAQLQHLKEDNRNNQKEVIYQMLLSWKQREGSQATRRVLADALQKAERKDLAELLQNGKDRGISNHGSTVVLPCSNQPVQLMDVGCFMSWDLDLDKEDTSPDSMYYY
ncbi:hypothetical protein HOLleu_18530 [Holothuria leucospilota]|uniref:Death domain-containing protein n=1 Tax=Holothuria leucospilota TaxID=206669 RepID=A0A9Q1C1X8_HOLLE|nr:hypothetical protein HOLleu_18530 [Holothuria leucospilota]